MKLARNLSITFVGIYIFAAQFLIPMNDWQEVYPFFHWSLFSEASPQANVYSVRITRFDGSQCLIEECSEFVSSNLQSVEFYFLMRNFGRKFQSRSYGEVQDGSERAQLENRLKTVFVKPFEYEVVKFKVNIIEYAKSRAFIKESIVYSNEVKP